jgi:K+ transporter
VRIFTFIVTSVFFAGASHRLFAGEYLEAALGVCIATQMWIIEYLVGRCKVYRECLDSIATQLDKLKEILTEDNEKD